MDINESDEKILDALQEGRGTPALLIDETGLSKPTVHSRLKLLITTGSVEKIHDSGVYELVEDPRDQKHNDDPSGRRRDQANRQYKETEEFDGIVEAVAENWDDAPERLRARKAAAQAVLDYAKEHGGVSKKEAKEKIYPDNPVDEQSPRTWYRKNIRPVLNEVAEYNQSSRRYELIDDET